MTILLLAVTTLLLFNFSFFTLKFKKERHRAFVLENKNAELALEANNALWVAKKQVDEENKKIIDAMKQEAQAEIKKKRQDVDLEIKEKKKDADAQIEARNKTADFNIQLRIDGMKKAFEAENVDLISQALMTKTATKLRSELKAISNTVFNRMTQEFQSQIIDESESLSTDLQFELLERIWDSFQTFKKLVKESPFIFPNGMKMAYTKGIRTVIVVEQATQIRSVSLHGSLLTNSDAQKAISNENGNYRFNLAFPYIYFVMVFDNEKYVFQEIYFRNKPLTSVREHVYPAPLPNVFYEKNTTNLRICMGGQDFKREVQQESSITRQVEYVIGEFWQRTFNSDTGTDACSKIDKRLKNYGTWQEHSTKDPFFILDVDWPKGKTIKGVVETILDQRKQTEELDSVDQHIRTLLLNGVNKVTTKINAGVMKAKSLELNQEDLSDKIQRTLEEVVFDHTNKVFDLCSKQ
jgi:hypothetical protein